MEFLRPILHTIFILFFTSSLLLADDIGSPIADAGPNQYIDAGSPIVLDGTGSSDVNGSIVSYVWRENGITLATGVTPTIGLIGLGVHTISLTVTDDDNLTSTDTVVITLSTRSLAAIDDVFSTTQNNTITRNFLSNDQGDNIVYITGSASTPSNGTLNILANGLFTYTPDTDYIGSDSFTYSITNNSAQEANATVTININNPLSKSYRPFTLRYQNSLSGNILTIGNTILVAPGTETSNTNVNCDTYTNGAYMNDTVNSNSSYRLCAYFADSSQLFPTTKAKLSLPSAESKVVWAGLYWQALVSSNDPNAPVNSSNMQIKIKHETDSSYKIIEADQVNWTHTAQTGFDNYAAFKDITDLFKTNTWGTGDIYVGNIPVFEGTVPSLGTYGAWSLVVVYDDKGQTLKNFSVYDGWRILSNSDGQRNVTIPITGFKTPKSVSSQNPIKSTLSVFTAEGDKRILNDALNVRPSLQSTDTFLSYVSNQTFNSSIKTFNSFDRVPSPSNNQGIDIQSYNLGTSGQDIIKPNESSIDVRLSTTGDVYWASMISFSSDLAIPKLCYDYVAKKDGYAFDTNDDRNISTHGKGEMSITVGIRSEEGDFDLKKTHMKLRLNVTGPVAFKRAAYSPNTVNTLIPAIFYNGNDSIPDIAIGESATTQGGTISRLQKYFAQFTYDQKSSTVNGYFDFDINTTINFGSGDVHYQYSTDKSKLGAHDIEQCSDFSGYQPIWGQFNIERTNSESFTKPHEKFPLYTQITGRDFDFSLVAYDANFSKPLAITEKTSVDVEIIDVKPFNDQAFKCSATDTSIIQQLPGNKRSIFVSFDGDGSHRVNQTSKTDLITNKALENAAFRMWLLVDENNSIIAHDCPQPEPSNGNKFDQCYIENVGPRINDPLNACHEDTCQNYVNQEDPTEKGCYACYRNYSAIAICSRDNFSIRPETYRLSIVDDNNSDDNNSNSSNKKSLLSNNISNSTSLAAGYTYKLEGNATKFKSEEVALQYRTESNLSLVFNDTTLTCADDNTYSSTYTFKNGQIITGANAFQHNNVGDYLARMIDKDWTRVDQIGGVRDDKGEDLKPFKNVDDCNKNDGKTSKKGYILSGCDIKSDFDTTHTDIALTFEPYQFDVNSVELKLIAERNISFLLMNDLSSYDDDLASATMLASIEGTITAQGADGKKLSNYTDSCHAKDKNITLILERTTLPTAEENLTSIGIGDCTANIVFQQRLIENANTYALVKGYDQNVTLLGTAFQDEDEGNASIILHTTFKKPISEGTRVNPIDMNYSSFIAQDTDSNYSADLTSNFPKGVAELNQSIIYYFSKLTPRETIYRNIAPSSVLTPIYVDIYCDFNDSFPENICRDRFKLTPRSKNPNEKSYWFSAFMFQPNGPFTSNQTSFKNLGLMDFNITHSSEFQAKPNIGAANNNDEQQSGKVISNIPFKDSGATQNDINVSVSGDKRPSIVQITVTPAPFLLYNTSGICNGTASLEDRAGLLQYKVIFVPDSIWSGVGNTGKTTNTSANRDSINRMTW